MTDTSFKTIQFTVDEHVATITLDRPDVLNAFDQQMCDDVAQAWRLVRERDDIHIAVLQAAGDRAFCTGIDRRAAVDCVTAPNVWNRFDPGLLLGPKSNAVWKPVICAVNGMAAGGAFYFINESDIVICSDDATFFDPHLSYGLVSALEPVGLSRRVPIGEAMRWALMGLDERMSSARAHQIGLVSEVVAAGDLHARAHQIAAKIAAKPPAAVQGTVKAIWEGLELSRNQAQMVGINYTHVGNPIGTRQVDPSAFASGRRPRWELR